MKFQLAQCKLCGRHIFDIKQVAAFRKTYQGVVLAPIIEQPTVGMVCLCQQCVDIINAPLQEEIANLSRLLKEAQFELRAKFGM